MRNFTTNIRGRIRNFPLPKNQPLVPLYEAIVNSLHAIAERKESDASYRQASISIEIEREPQMVLDADMLPVIHSFVIKDNGIGFNERNFESFMESDSIYKVAIGGKGVGRFSWLAAFEKAEITSIYKENGIYVKRDFEFDPDSNEIDDSLVGFEADDNCTSIYLKNCINPYRDNLPKKAITIAMRIIQHCLVYFINEDCPKIRLIDIDGTII